MGALLLGSLVSSLALAELPPGTTWRWTVASGGGQPERVLLLFESNPPPPRRITERWALEVGRRELDGTTTAVLKVRGAGGNADHRFSVWVDGGVLVFRDLAHPTDAPRPVVERQAPPRVLSTERVVCTSALLGGGDGVCAGRAGGPLHAPELPLSLVLAEDQGAANDALRALAIGVLTGGVVIPGHVDTSVIATLEPPPRLPLAAPLERWRKSARTVAALDKAGLPAELDAETAGALLALGGKPSVPVVSALAQRVPEVGRWPLLRLARQRGLAAPALLATVSKLQDAGALHPATTDEDRALQASALRELDVALTTAIDGLLAGQMPALRAVAARVGAPDFEATVEKALETATLSAGEGVALALLLPEATRRKNVPRFLERLPTPEAGAVMDSLLEHLSPSERTQLVLRVPQWVDRQVRSGDARATFAALSFDDERVRVLDGTLARAQEAERPTLLVTACSLLSFDDGKLALLRKWKATKLSVAQREAVLASFFQGAALDEAVTLLSANLGEVERAEVTLAWLLATTPDARRAELLASRQGLRLDLAQARRMYASFAFDAGRAAAAPTLLGLFPEAEQPALLVEFLGHMTFDDGRLALLEAAPPSARRLTPEQRATVLKSFSSQRAKAEAALGR